jgi:hypothetical protein
MRYGVRWTRCIARTRESKQTQEKTRGDSPAEMGRSVLRPYTFRLGARRRGPDTPRPRHTLRAWGTLRF